MTCEFCGKFKEKEEFKHKVILDSGDRQVVIYCCQDCLEMLEVLLKQQYIGRNKIEQDFLKMEVFE